MSVLLGVKSTDTALQQRAAHALPHSCFAPHCSRPCPRDHEVPTRPALYGTHKPTTGCKVLQVKPANDMGLLCRTKHQPINQPAHQNPALGHEATDGSRTVQPYPLTLRRPLTWATYSRLRSLSVVIVCMDAQLSHCVLTKLGIRSRQPDVRLTCKRTGELMASRPPQSEVSYVKGFLCANVQGAHERCPAQGQAWKSCQAQRHV